MAMPTNEFAKVTLARIARFGFALKFCSPSVNSPSRGRLGDGVVAICAKVSPYISKSRHVPAPKQFDLLLRQFPRIYLVRDR